MDRFTAQHEAIRKDQKQQAMRVLWIALELSRQSGLGLTGPDDWETKYQAWRTLGELVLGDELHDYEVLT